MAVVVPFEKRLFRFRARLAEQVHEQAEGAGAAFGQLARER